MSPAPSLGSRPLRTIAVGALGVGVLALGIGLVTLSGPSQNNTAGPKPLPPAQTTTTTTSAPGTSPQATTRPSSPNPLLPTTSAAPSPPPTQRPTEQSNQPVAPAPRAAVRVYNNSLISGLADRAAEDLRRSGYAVPEVGNYSGGLIYTTTVYYRPGTAEEAQAREVASLLRARMEPRFSGIAHSPPGVIAIITKEYLGPQADGKSVGN